MALKTSLGEIRSCTQNPTDPVGCSIDHYILTIVGDSVTKLSNLEPQGRMPMKFRSINSFCSQEKRNPGKVSFVEGLRKASMFSEQTDCDLRSNKLSDGRKLELPSNENGITSYDIFMMPGTDDMTLKELHLKCKAKKRKFKRELQMSAPTSPLSEEYNESYSKVQLKEPDLSEPLISIKRKRLKRCMRKREMVKERKVCMPVSLSSSSVTSVENYVQHLTCVEEETMEGNIDETPIQTNSTGKSESELDRFSLYSSTELVDDMGDELSTPVFHKERDATDIISDVSNNFINKSQFSGDQSIGDLHEVHGYSEDSVMVAIDKASSEVKSDASHHVVEPENGSFHTHGKNSVSADGSRYDALPLKEQKDVHCAFTPKVESHIPMALSFAEEFEDNRGIEVQSSENDECLNNIRINLTSKLSLHISNPQCIQNDSHGTYGVSFPEITDHISASPILESCMGSTQLQCHRDNFRTCHSATTGGLTLPSLMEECNMDSMKTDRFAQCPTSKENDCLYPNVQACGSYAEDTDRDDDKDLKMKKIVTEDMQGESLNDQKFKDVWDGMCISSGDKETNDISENVYVEMTPVILESDLPSSNVLDTTIDTPTVNGVSPPISTDTETVGTCEEVVANSLDNEEFREIEENECRSHQNILLPPTNDSLENVSTTILDGDNLAASVNCKDPQAPERGEALNICKNIKPVQPPRKLPSNRKVFCPSSKEKLYQVLESGEFYESMRYYKNRRKLSLDKWLDSPPLSDRKEAERKFSPEKVFAKPRNTCCITKGILKSASSRGCNIEDTSPPTSHSQDAIKFSQRQMRDIDSIKEKLLTVVKSMKSVMEETLNLEEFASTNLKSTTEKMTAAIEDATAVEATTQKYMSMMNRDFKRFCKIMRLRDCDATDKINAPKKQRKITFADEVGGPLCHVKVFEEPSALAAVGSNGTSTD